MSNKIDVYQICPQCGGDGLYGETHGPDGQGSMPCNWTGCNGTGYILLGFFELDPSLGDLQDKHEDILDKLDDVLELLRDE